MSAVPIAFNPVADAGMGETLEECSLAQAFASFTQTALSLERSYQQLQGEVARLRQELEERNRALLASLEEHRRTREFLRRILETLPCGVLVVDSGGAISIANPEARRLLGWEAERELRREVELPAWLAMDESVAPAASAEQECFACGRSWVAVRRAPLPSAEGTCSLFTLRDISQSKQVEELQSKLRRREALAEMSAVLAHEIRNPLGSLELFAGLLAQAQLPSECETWVQHVQAGLRSLTATVNNVLQFHASPGAELLRTDLEGLLQGFECLLRPLTGEAGIELQASHALAGVRVRADRNQLQQVLFNLALNAVRFMPEGGQLKITGQVQSSPGGLSAVIEVEDTGPGIAPEEWQRIFEPGFTTRPGSPGLGLAVCKTIMEQHGGSISVVAKPAAGAIFRLQLPLAEGGEA